MMAQPIKTLELHYFMIHFLMIEYKEGLSNKPTFFFFFSSRFRLPPLSVPSLSRISKIFADAFVIAVVIFATNISISKMFAKKRGYSVDPNQVCIV